jgi:hypothetical protein
VILLAESDLQDDGDAESGMPERETEVRYSGWGVRYLYQFATVNPLLGILIAILIVLLFAIVIPVVFSKLFIDV